MSPLTISPRLRKLAVVLGVAGLGSTAAYGIGTQVGDGVAGAKTTSSATAQRPGPSASDLQSLADKLGVSVAKLKAALQANRPPKPAKPSGDPMATALAKELGVSADKVKAALDATRPPKPAAGSKPPANGTRPPRPDSTALAKALADKLGLDQSTVKAALDKLEAQHQADETARRQAMASALAKQLGLDEAKVSAALASWHPPHGPGPGGPPQQG
jgi:DNA-binding transcriptional MerR regulator